MRDTPLIYCDSCRQVPVMVGRDDWRGTVLCGECLRAERQRHGTADVWESAEAFEKAHRKGVENEDVS